MYAMTAAHPTLPLPSYARVTGVASGKTVVVRVNDRGPFLHGRIIDLSYAAAHKIGIAQRGSGEVIVEAILPGDKAGRGRRAAAGGDARGGPAAACRRPSKRHRPPLGGYVVQLGAFGDYGNAQNFLAHVQGQLATAGRRAQGAAGDRLVARLRRSVPGPRRGPARG
jgi:rare lipoprotein A